MEKFAIGLLVGALGGALLAVNSHKTRMLVKQSQEGVKEKLEELWEEKCGSLCEKTSLCPSESDETTGAGTRSAGKTDKTEQSDKAEKAATATAEKTEKRSRREEKKNAKAVKTDVADK